MRFLLSLASLLSFFVAWSQKSTPTSWPRALADKQATITVYWFESKPFIYRDAEGRLAGIEFRIMQQFREFVKQEHNVDLVIEWKEAKSFGDTFDRIRKEAVDGTFGVSAFSITPDRQQQVAFSPAYMPDLSVLISNPDVPIVKTAEQFCDVFKGLTAITIAATTYEKDLMRIKNSGTCNFNMRYIPSSENVLTTIEKTPGSFGFIDLPVYLMRFNQNPSYGVRRQNIFPTRREGYAIIFPLNGSWAPVVKACFENPSFKNGVKEIMNDEMDVDAYEFIESLGFESSEAIALLNKEKEIQTKSLISRENDLAEEVRMRNFLLGLVLACLLLLVAAFWLFIKQNQQKNKIIEQQQSIQLKNEELERRNEQLVQLDEEKNSLIHILAHDLRVPVNHIQGLAQVLQLGYSLDPEEQQVALSISEAAQRLNRMIANILNIDALERGQVQITMEPLRVTEVLKQVVVSFENQAKQKNITLNNTWGSADIVVRGNELYLLQVFENLLSNAIKFTPKEKTVALFVTATAAEVEVSIRDEGPGISVEEQPMLFKKFKRLSARPTAGEPSTGLGLFIVKRYTELMGGKVTFNSVMGKGTTFTVTLPRVS